MRIAAGEWACVLTCLDGTRMTPLALDNVSPGQCRGSADDCESFRPFTGEQLDRCLDQAPPGVVGSARASPQYLHIDAYPFPDSDTCVSFQTAISRPAGMATSGRRLLEAQNDAQAAHCGCKDMMGFIYQEALAQIPLGGVGGFCNAALDYAAGKLGKRYCKTVITEKGLVYSFAKKLCSQLLDPITAAAGDALGPVCEAGVNFIREESRNVIDLDDIVLMAQNARQEFVQKVAPYVDQVCGPIACSDGSPTSGCSKAKTKAPGSVATILQLASTGYCGFGGGGGSGFGNPSGMADLQRGLLQHHYLVLVLVAHTLEQPYCCGLCCKLMSVSFHSCQAYGCR